MCISIGLGARAPEIRKRWTSLGTPDLVPRGDHSSWRLGWDSRSEVLGKRLQGIPNQWESAHRSTCPSSTGLFRITGLADSPKCKYTALEMPLRWGHHIIIHFWGRNEEYSGEISSYQDVGSLYLQVMNGWRKESTLAHHSSSESARMMLVQAIYPGPLPGIFLSPKSWRVTSMRLKGDNVTFHHLGWVLREDAWQREAALIKMRYFFVVSGTDVKQPFTL